MDASDVVYDVVYSDEVVRIVRDARNAVTQLETDLAWAQQTLEQTPEWQEMQRIANLLDEQKTQAALREAALREAALLEYSRTQSKNPLPGVSIKLFTRLNYIPAAALQWCKVNASALVKEVLDTKSFEKIAASLPGAPVEVSEEPRVYIAADLDKALS